MQCILSRDWRKLPVNTAQSRFANKATYRCGGFWISSVCQYFSFDNLLPWLFFESLFNAIFNLAYDARSQGQRMSTPSADVW